MRLAGLNGADMRERGRKDERVLPAGLRDLYLAARVPAAQLDQCERITGDPVQLGVARCEGSAARGAGLDDDLEGLRELPAHDVQRLLEQSKLEVVLGEVEGRVT